MRHKESNPYFQLQHGLRVSEESIRQEAPFTMSAVDTYKESGKIVGQYILPEFDGHDPDLQLWMPERVQEREIALQIKMLKIKAELAAIARGQEFDHGIYNPLVPVEMVPNIEYSLKRNA